MVHICGDNQSREKLITRFKGNELNDLQKDGLFVGGNFCQVLFDTGFFGELPQLILGDLKWLISSMRKETYTIT